MSPNELADKLAEQWRLVKSAPFPYAAALVILAGLMFGAFQWGYGRVLDQKDAQIGTIKARLDAVTAERDDLKAKLAALPTSAPTASADRDPDSIYQFGAVVASAPAGQVDRPNGTVSFQSVIGTPNFNIHTSMEYRQFTINNCRFGGMGEQSSFGIVTQQEFAQVTCQIAGLHP